MLWGWLKSDTLAAVERASRQHCLYQPVTSWYRYSRQSRTDCGVMDIRALSHIDRTRLLIPHSLSSTKRLIVIISTLDAANICQVSTNPPGFSTAAIRLSSNNMANTAVSSPPAAAVCDVMELSTDVKSWRTRVTTCPLCSRRRYDSMNSWLPG